jgi:hypothetical protein
MPIVGFKSGVEHNDFFYQGDSVSMKVSIRAPILWLHGITASIPQIEIPINFGLNGVPSITSTIVHGVGEDITAVISTSSNLIAFGQNRGRISHDVAERTLVGITVPRVGTTRERDRMYYLNDPEGIRVYHAQPFAEIGIGPRHYYMQGLGSITVVRDSDIHGRLIYGVPDFADFCLPGSILEVPYVLNVSSGVAMDMVYACLGACNYSNEHYVESMLTLSSVEYGRVIRQLEESGIGYTSGTRLLTNCTHENIVLDDIEVRLKNATGSLIGTLFVNPIDYISPDQDNTCFLYVNEARGDEPMGGFNALAMPGVNLHITNRTISFCDSI